MLHSSLQLLSSRLSFQAAISIEESLDDIETAHASGTLEIQSRATIGQIHSSLTTSVRQTSRHGILMIARTRLMIDIGAMVQEDLHERVLHTCPKWVNTGGDETKRGRSATVHVCLRINIRARFQ